ncbi:MAG: hypothetical protein WAV95_17025 [Azonexus sp.]
MLRRVSYETVSVFLAFTHPRMVALKLYEVAANGGQGPLLTAAGGSAATRPIGANLHVVTVTLRGLSLQPLTRYFYDVEITRTGTARPSDTAGPNLTLASLPGDLLTGRDPLGYAIGTLPSFVTPPRVAAKLHFYHGSCRKFHGGGSDAMLRLDEALENVFDRPDLRPQMLFLTGDQIYADDVAGPLLPVLTELSKKLLGWEEKVPDAGGPSLLSGFPPGTRERFILRAPLSSGAGHAHLLGLGEFYAMYLLAFSPALWPSILPNASAVLPAGALTPAPDHGKGVDEAADITAIRAYLVKVNWDAQSKQVLALGKGMAKVRRAFANIPSYMMFDDHEVTDDWYLHSQWQVDVLSSPIGQRVIGNALSAFAVFQAWGNDPDGTFAPGGMGTQILDALVAIGALNGETYKAGQSQYDVIRQLLRVTAQSGGSGILWDYGFRLTQAEWQALVLDTRTHRNLTRPGQTDLIDILDLPRQIAARASALAQPSSAQPAKVTVLVSPAPVFGHPMVEEAVGHAANREFNAALGTLDPSLDNSLPITDQVANLALNKKDLRTETDNETWRNEVAPAAFESFLDELSRLGRVIILSGDVHYGFSASIGYWNMRAASIAYSAFVQLCSSALQNEDDQTRLVGTLGSRELVPLLDKMIKDNTGHTRQALSTFMKVARIPVGVALERANYRLGKEAAKLLKSGGRLLDNIATIAPALTPPARIDYVAWANSRPDFPAASNMTRAEVMPAVVRVRKPMSLPQPDWAYRLHFAADLSPIYEDMAEAPENETNAARKKRLLDELVTSGPSSQHRLVIGQSNIGRVEVLGADGKYLVRHSLERMDGGRRPTTVHLLNLEPPEPADPAPGTLAASFAPNLSLWAGLMSYRETSPLAADIHPIESGSGPLVLDCYGLHISRPPARLPNDSTTRAAPVPKEEFMADLRRMMVAGELLDPLLGGYSGKTPADAGRWLGAAAQAKGAILTEHQYYIASLSGATVDGTLDYAATWVDPAAFHLALTGQVALVGKRGFYLVDAPGGETGWYLFTIGVHRAGTAIAIPDGAWARLHNLWQSFPARLLPVLRSLGGEAEAFEAAQHRVSWSDATSGWFSP